MPGTARWVGVIHGRAVGDAAPEVLCACSSTAARRPLVEVRRGLLSCRDHHHRWPAGRTPLRLSKGGLGQAAARLRGAEKHRARGRARSAHRGLTRRGCLNGATAGSAVSSATGPRDRASQGSRRSAPTAEAKRRRLPGLAFAAPIPAPRRAPEELLQRHPNRAQFASCFEGGSIRAPVSLVRWRRLRARRRRRFVRPGSYWSPIRVGCRRWRWCEAFHRPRNGCGDIDRGCRRRQRVEICRTQCADGSRHSTAPKPSAPSSV